MSRDSLTPKQARFVQEYLIDRNGAAAARRAKYSKKSADKIASQLLADPAVAAAIAAGAEKTATKLELKAERVLLELMRIGFSDVRGLFAEDGGLLAPHEWPDDLAHSVASVEIEELFEGRGDHRHQIGFTKKVKLWDKTRGLEMLGKNLALFVEKLELTGKDGQPLSFVDLMAKASEHAKKRSA